MDKKRKCLKEITNTRNNKEIEYGYEVRDEEIMDLDILTENEEDLEEEDIIEEEDIEYGYVVEDEEIMELDLISSEEIEFYKDFFIPNF
ncbi:uncharacterized protein VNE69_09038 [Vairimorpha necatrix]|uniref:Uncharacterized protein n=1 Tax=Vairimorpha necatrix TaxID=6039 RepID=A0AAX4JF55_9MICR